MLLSYSRREYLSKWKTIKGPDATFDELAWACFKIGNRLNVSFVLNACKSQNYSWTNYSVINFIVILYSFLVEYFIFISVSLAIVLSISAVGHYSLGIHATLLINMGKICLVILLRDKFLGPAVPRSASDTEALWTCLYIHCLFKYISIGSRFW